DEHRSQPARLQGPQTLLRARQKTDVLAQLVLQSCDIELEGSAPIVRAIPVERSLLGGEQGRQNFLRALDADAAALRIALGNGLAPEIVVETQVEERAVHVEQHRVDAGPCDEGGRGSAGLWD